MLNLNSTRLLATAPWIFAAGGLLVGLTGAAYGLRNRCEPIVPGAAAAAAPGKAAIEKLSPFATKPTVAQPAAAAKIAAPGPALAPVVLANPEAIAPKEPAPQPRIVQFNLPKSKHLQQLGPVRVALRKSDVKHQQYNLNLAMLDGQTVEKKNVNLMEPVYVSSAALPQQRMEFVVNRIEKDRVSGYIRIPNDSRPAPQP